MEVAVLAGTATLDVGVIEVLRVGLVVVDVALGVVFPLVEGALALEQLADDVVAGLVQHPVPLIDFVAGGQHGLQRVARQ